jgi:hypothetical protein
VSHRTGTYRALSLDSAGKTPSEFLVWRAGRNPTRNGFVVLFDDVAAASVMAAYREHGVDVMLDLEHMSLDDRHPNWTPDAVGWAQLEMRGGDLWAVNVRWTPDGTRRLSEQTQRYTSPTFRCEAVDGDERTQRPTALVNIALVAMPATDQLPALVAKQKGSRTMNITSQTIAAVRKTLRRQLPAADMIRALAEDVGDAEAAPGKSFMELAEFLGVTIDPGVDPIGFISALKDGVAAMMAGLEASPAPAPEAPEEMAGKPEEEPESMKALRRLTGAKDLADVLVTVADWRKLAVEHEETQRKIAAEHRALEATKRRQLTARLVTCGSETPATAWADDAKTVPAKHLATLSIDELEARVASFEARQGLRAAPMSAPARTAAADLSDRELAICKEIGVDPATYATNKARKEAAPRGR